MDAKEASLAIESFFLDYVDDLSSPRIRTLDVIDKEKRLHHGPSGKKSWRNPMGLDRWSKNHKREIKGIGALPYMPSIFPDQIINRPTRPITRLHKYLPEPAYLAFLRKFYDISIGSPELSQRIIDEFDNTQAFEDSDMSVTDWAIDCLENDVNFGITSGHFETLTDIADMQAGLSLAVAARRGRKHIENFKLLINKNMTRESYKYIPLPWLLSVGLVPYWGLPPGNSLEENGITDDISAEVNGLMIDQYRRDRKLGAVALGFVLAGSRPSKVIDPDTEQVLALKLRDPYTGSFAARCEGGVVVANRVHDNFEISGVISTTAKNRVRLIDELHEAHARQGARLLDTPVGYTVLSGEHEGQDVYIKAA